jgi:hypothetical protein
VQGQGRRMSLVSTFFSMFFSSPPPFEPWPFPNALIVLAHGQRPSGLSVIRDLTVIRP